MANNIKSQRVSLAGLLGDISKIVIPIIQRDYAQGRSHESEVRNNFLTALKEYLLDPNQEEHDLDFVYGNKNKDDEFIPLDGQQRLTTLFLLHYYLAIHDDRYDSFRNLFVANGKHSRFIYQTRRSATDFCNALVNNPLKKEQLSRISEVIKDECLWFSQSWENDPTVKAMLIMLDTMDSYFGNTQGLYDRLTDPQHPAVTFRILFMEESGLNDDLYIKMNSRGLELTTFENVKARILQILKKEKNRRYQLQRSAGASIEEVSAKDYFAHNIDNNWADLFWVYRKTRSHKTIDGNSYTVPDIDTPLLNFMATIALNNNATNDTHVTNDDMVNYNKLTWSFFSKLKCGNLKESHEDVDFYLHLTDIFDVFYHNADLSDSETKGIHNPLEGKSSFDIRSVFEKFISKGYNDAAYREHIQFYAYYEYMLKHGQNCNTDDLAQWMRIVTNLAKNTIYNRPDDFERAMKSIRWLLENNVSGILNLLAGNEAKRSEGFLPSQFKEECIKAALMLRPDGKEWEKRILNAEGHQYLDGQIISLLHFCGVEEYYDTHQQRCDWDSTCNYLDAFDKYLRLIKLVFDDKGLRTELDDDRQLFRRALLTYGDYSIAYGYNRWSLGVNNSRYFGWKRMLCADEDFLKGSRDIFKQLIDDIPSDRPLEEHLQHRIDSQTAIFNDWASLLIGQLSLWKDFSKTEYFISSDNSKEDILLLSASTRRGWYSEIRTLYLHNQLEQKGFNVKYNHVYGTDEYPCVTCKNDDETRELYIEYYHPHWVYSYSATNASKQTVMQLESIGFTLNSESGYYILESPSFDENLLRNVL